MDRFWGFVWLEGVEVFLERHVEELRLGGGCGLVSVGVVVGEVGWGVGNGVVTSVGAHGKRRRLAGGEGLRAQGFTVFRVRRARILLG